MTQNEKAIQEAFKSGLGFWVLKFTYKPFLLIVFVI